MLSSLASAETNGQLLREFGTKNKIKYIYTINNSDFTCTTCIFRSLTAYTMQEARNNQQSRKPSSWTDETIIFFFLSLFTHLSVLFFSLFQTTGFLEENRCALDTVRSPLLHELEIYKQNGEMLVIARVKICVSFKCFF